LDTTASYRRDRVRLNAFADGMAELLINS